MQDMSGKPRLGRKKPVEDNMMEEKDSRDMLEAGKYVDGSG